MKNIILAIFLPVAFILCGCAMQVGAAPTQNVKGDLKISMLNIGHGDAILIQTKEQTILIDTANSPNRDLLVGELKKFSVTKIDKLILTHPHIDHIGGARMLIKPTKNQLDTFPYLRKISVVEVYDNGIAYTSPAYKNLIKTIAMTGMKYQSLKTGDTLDFGNGVKFNVIFPTSEFVLQMNSGEFDPKKDRQYNTNNGSIVGKLTYKDFSMMFTGDCEKESEAKILASNAAEDLQCDVLKAGHHASNTSSTKNFVNAINPSCVLISAAEKKEDGYISFGHPHSKVLETYLKCAVEPRNIFCTRKNGTITVISDGKNFSVQPDIELDWVEDWIAGKKLDKKIIVSSQKFKERRTN